MKRIGIFGGSFNPIHNGHLTVAEYAIKQNKLDMVYFVPCNIPPPDYKTNKDFVETYHRLNMIALAIKNKSKLNFTSIEIQRGGISYTIDTINYFKSEYPKSELYFICGDDAYETLSTWKNHKQITTQVKFIVFHRYCNISSTLIRDMIKKNIKIKVTLPPMVKGYIDFYKLYK